MSDLWDSVKSFGSGAHEFLDQSETMHGLWDFGSRLAQGGADRVLDTFPTKSIADGIPAMDAYKTGFGPGVQKGMGALGFGLDLIDVGKGSYNFTSGLSNDGFSSDDTWSGLHDLLAGGTGGLGYALEGTPAGAVLSSFSAGMDIGDLIAPHVFGPMEEAPGTRKMETIPEEGFKPSCGNEFIDEAIADLQDGVGFGDILDVATTATPIGALAEVGDALTDAVGIGDILPSFDEISLPSFSW